MFRRSLGLLGLVGVLFLAGCGAGAPASAERARYLMKHGGTVPEQEVRVEEHLNFYPQNLPAPAYGDVGVYLATTRRPSPWGGAPIVILAGAQARTARYAGPRNLALVLDRSGSMAEQDKMTYLQQAVRTLLRSLRPDDRVSVVIFGTRARVLLSGVRGGETEAAERAIADVDPSGNTNLAGGLALGFEEVRKYRRPGVQDKVILFTDGLPNVGETDPDRIAREVERNAYDGIRLAAIGVGEAYGDDLLRKVAQAGRGAYHFLESPREIERIFRAEADTLLTDVGRDAWLTVSLPPGLVVRKVYHSRAQVWAGGVRAPLDDLGSSGTAMLLLEAEPGGGASAGAWSGASSGWNGGGRERERDAQAPSAGWGRGAAVPAAAAPGGWAPERWGSGGDAAPAYGASAPPGRIEARLEYAEAATGARRCETAWAAGWDGPWSASSSFGSAPDVRADFVVRRAYTLARFAEGLIEIDRARRAGDREGALRIVRELQSAVSGVQAEHAEDELAHDLEALREYERTLMR